MNDPRYVSDVIAELIAEAGVDYVAFNPGATFRAVHDSLVNHLVDGPEIVLCATEGISVAVAHGYAKASGRAMAVFAHNIVGLQSASMGLYNAWCDRAPILVVGGTGPRSKQLRRPWIDWIHTAVDQGAVVRDFVKWDDEPHDAESVGESFARAWMTANSAPEGPVYLCYDVALQESELGDGFARPSLTGFSDPTEPAPDPAAVERLAAMLSAAQRPAIVAGHAGGTPESFAALVGLAGRLGAPVVDAGWRLAFPSDHPLNATRLDRVLEQADLIVALDVDDIVGKLGAATAPLLNVGVGHTRTRGWSHDYQPLPRAALHVAATADATVAALLARLGNDERPSPVVERAAEIGARTVAERVATRRRAASAEAPGAVAVERLLFELGELLAGQRYVLANGTNARLEHGLWSLDRCRQYLGATGGGGLGYGLGAAIGASLAVGRQTITVDVQPDGDFLFVPSALWTMARLRLPILTVLCNNRQYGNSVEHAIKIAELRGRDAGNRYVGTGLEDPAVDFATLARSFGVWASGPIADPAELPSALEQALDVVRSGRPALVDVIVPGF